MGVRLHQLGDDAEQGAPISALVLGAVTRRVAPDGTVSYLFLARLEFLGEGERIGCLVSTRDDAFSPGEEVDLSVDERTGDWVGWEI